MYPLERRFKPGDLVEFELRRDFSTGQPSPFPRWDDSEDRGGSGCWCQAIVTAWHEDALETHFFNADTGRHEVWFWNKREFEKNKLGWLRPVAMRRCECGAIKTWGSGPHSSWCPLYTNPFTN